MSAVMLRFFFLQAGLLPGKVPVLPQREADASSGPTLHRTGIITFLPHFTFLIGKLLYKQTQSFGVTIQQNKRHETSITTNIKKIRINMKLQETKSVYESIKILQRSLKL